MKVDGRSRSVAKALETLKKTTVCEDNRYSVGMLWSYPRSTLSNNYRSAVKLFLSLKTRLSKNAKLKTVYSDTIRTDEESDYIRKLDPIEICDTRNDPQWFPNKPGKVRRVCVVVSEFEGFSLNKNLFVGLDLLQNIICIIYRLREKPFGMSADIEAMFLQVKVPVADAKGLRFNLMICQPMSTPATFSVPRIPLLVLIMLYNAQPRTTRTNFPMFRK